MSNTTTPPLDPEVAAALAQIPPLPKDIEAQRKMVRHMNVARPPAAPDGTFTRRDVVLAAAGERPELTVRVYEPQNSDGPRAGVLYFHAGGFAVGDLDADDAVCLALCRTGSVVVSVDYRLAPEHQAPAPVVDGYDALEWLTGHAAELGVAAGAIGVSGISAGGGIAAAVALMARDRSGPPVAFQLLLSPALDDRMDWPSCRFEDVPLWNRADTEAMWARYLGADPDAAGAYGVPARAKDLHDLPGAYIVTGEIDPMRDAAIDYATRLLHAGVSTELHVFPGTPHGWDMFCAAWPASPPPRRPTRPSGRPDASAARRDPDPRPHQARRRAGHGPPRRLRRRRRQDRGTAPRRLLP